MSTFKFEIDQLPELMAALSDLNAKLAEYKATQQEGIWLDDAAVMKRLNISKSTLNSWRDLYGLPYSQLGEVRRYRPEEVDEWMAMFRPGNKQAMQVVNAGIAKKAQKVA